MPKLSKLSSGLRTSLTDTTSELRGHSQSDLDSAREEEVVSNSEADILSVSQETNEAMGALQPDPEQLAIANLMRESVKSFAKFDSELARLYLEGLDDEGLSELLQPDLPTNDRFRLNAVELLTQSTRKCIEAMITTLASQLSCCNGNHFMRLKLTGFVRQFDHEMRPFFDLYLSSGHDGARSYWVESKCTFTRRLTQREKMGCDFIKNSILAKKKSSLFLREPGEQQDLEAWEDAHESLRAIQLGICDETNSPATPIVSLASLLNQDESIYHIRRLSNAERFSIEDRCCLCLNLALSLLHMSGRLWNRAIWHSDNPNTENGIFFLRDPRTQEIVEKTQPYMSWRLQEESIIQKPTKELRYDTQLLSFAKLLIEIRTWEKLHFTPEPESEEELQSRLMSYIEVNFNSERELEFISALKACLNHAEFIGALAKDEPERAQAYVFETIVKPLHRYLGCPELPNTNWIPMPSSNEAALVDSNQSENTLSMYDSRYEEQPGRRSPYEKMFWTKMEEFLGKYIRPLALSDDFKRWPKEKVRIAVIDSGVKREDAEIVVAEATQRIRGYRNFTSSDLDDCEDRIGHGTMVARLLLTVAPEAELYIAKVLDQKTMSKNQLHRIAEAIKWAVLEWDVDIISLSPALSEEHYDINEELTQAVSPSSRKAKAKLVFAAAGKQGPNEPRTWPANISGVIAVHATYWSGEGAKFNPNPRSRLNLSTLGHNIEMPCSDPANPDERKNVYISGSSFATPIAAGIAANVLEFARHSLELTDRSKDLIYSHHGMTKILKAMSCRRRGYDFVHPLAFWEAVFRGGTWKGQMLPRKNPQNICKVLNSILLDQSLAISPKLSLTQSVRRFLTKRMPEMNMEFVALEITDDEDETESSSTNPPNWCVWSRASTVEELEHLEVKNTAELPFEIPRSSKYGRPTIVPVWTKSQTTGRQFLMKKIYLQSEFGKGADERRKQLCLQEAMILWHARHQHVIEVAMAFTFEGDDTDPLEEPYFGIVMELAEQGDISGHLACQRPAAERAKIATWFRCLANATAYIHSIGIRHRDIKPENILLKRDGTVKLADFGISKMRLGRTSSTTTPEGPRANTIRYAAPEVGEGSTRGRQADIFALGAVFLEMLIAHSFENLRPQLSEKIKSSKLGARLGYNVPSPAYAPSLGKVHDWINEIQADLRCGEEHWHRTILSLCLKMTSEIREARPSAEEVYSIILGSESLKEGAASSCNCDVASVQTESQKLTKACQRPDGYDEVVSLLKNENNLHTKGAIQQAASHGHLSVVQQFLARGADVNQVDYCNQTALHCAAGYGHADITKLLLEHGAKIDITDEEEQLPLHCASGQGQLEVVEMLLAHDITGATMLGTDCYGQMPLHCAAKRGFTNVVRFLIDRMNNNAIIKTDARQRTALHLAAAYGSEAVVRLLLDNVTDKGFVDSLDKTHMTALHWATIGRQRNGGYVKVMEVLLERGADVNIKGGAGDTTAINYARDNQDEERIAVLLRTDKIAR